MTLPIPDIETGKSKRVKRNVECLQCAAGEKEEVSSTVAGFVVPHGIQFKYGP